LDNQLHPRAQLQLVGHQQTFDQLSKAFTSTSFPPVWLLVGEKGIGKATLAYCFARLILASSYDNQQMIARQTAIGAYPNLITLEKEVDSDGKIKREISIDVVRNAMATLRQSPAIPGWRVVIVDAIDEMNRNAANALLKILEEPPIKTVILLVCHAVGNVLPTIRSRCCQIPVHPLNDQEIMGILDGSPAEKSVLIKLARGSLGRALNLQKIGANTLIQELLHLFDTIFKGDFRSIQTFADRISKDEDAFVYILDLLQECIYRLILYAHKGEDSSKDVKAFDQLLHRRPVSHWIEVWQRLHAFSTLAKTSSLDKKHTLMAAFFILENPHSGDCFLKIAV